MSSGSFLYFFPDLPEKELTRDWLRKSPVAEPLRDIWERGEGWRMRQHGTVHSGPGGKSGTIFAAITNDAQSALFNAEHQEWHDVGTHWIGVDKRFRPDAVGLARRKLIPGVDRELAVGGVWLLPTIRRPAVANPAAGICCLPTVETSGRGKPAHKLPERYAAIWELTAKLFAWYFLNVPLADEKAESVRIIFDAAATCLGINYRVGPHEIDLLECFEDDDTAEVIRAAIGAHEVEEIIEAQNREPNANPSTAPG